MKIKRKGLLRQTAVFVAVIISLVFALTFLFLPKRNMAYAESGELKVHFVNVGQGDCCIIEFPDGKLAVIDGAEDKKKHEDQIQTFIDNNYPDLKYFDYAILTHPDSDHCGSLDYILEKYPSRVCYRPNVEAVGTKSNPYEDAGKADLSDEAVIKETVAYANAIKAMYATTPDFTSTVYVTDPSVEEQTITGGSGDDRYVLNFYSPLSGKYSDWNNYSPIMVLEYRGFKFMLSGDAEKENEKEFVEKVNAAPTDGVDDKYDVFDDEFCVNVFKAGHHGSRTSSSQGLLDVMTTVAGAPSVYYIFSCDPVGNKYGHPHQEVIDRLSAMGVPDTNMLRTDYLGDISFTVKLDGDGYRLFYSTKNGDGGSQNEIPKDEEAPEESIIEKYWLYIVIAVVVIIIIIAVYLYIKKKNAKKGKGKSGSKRGGSKGRR